jgi:hypothetical protein
VRVSLNPFTIWQDQRNQRPQNVTILNTFHYRRNHLEMSGGWYVQPAFGRYEDLLCDNFQRSGVGKERGANANSLAW